MEQKIHTIIVTYNGSRWIKECLESLYASTLLTEIIIVDNGSYDDTLKIVTDSFSDVILLKQSENLGFGKANNIGISYAIKEQATAVFLLNQDAKVDKTTIESLSNTAFKYPEIGVLSPLQLNWEGTELEYYFQRFLTRSTSVIEDKILLKKEKEIYKVPFVNAAAWFIPSEVLKSVGGFDPLFFHYGEDNNFCQRIIYHNFSIGILTNAEIYHDASIRNEPKDYLFSEKYFQNERTQFLIKACDINQQYSKKSWKTDLTHVFKLMTRNLLKFDFKAVKGYSKKYSIFKALKNKLFKSRTLNKTKGSHYLEN
jgi:GT2 family glycosyltransferase